MILIENKADLVPDFMNTNDEFTRFSQKNKFSSGFRTSAKCGLNINESMDYLINLIVSNLEKKLKVFDSKRNNSIILDRTMLNNSKQNNCC